MTAQTDLPHGIDYRAHGVNGCYSAAIAYLMYRIGAPSRLWDPSAIDAITRREKDRGTSPTNTRQAVLSLLENGAEIIKVSAFDAERCLAEGLSYVREFDRDGWQAEDPDGYYAYWTEERVHDDITQRREYRRRLQAYGERAREVIREPTMQDIKKLVGAGYAVLAAINNGGDPGTCHVVVVVGVEREPGRQIDSLLYFDNNHDEIRSRYEMNFEDRLYADEGVLAVRAGQHLSNGIEV